jgi:hypothetical protein
VTALASVSDLASYVGREIANDDASALLALELASGVVREYCGQTLTLVEDDEVTLNGSGTRVLLLPETPVTDVASVTVEGVELEADYWDWTSDGVINRIGGTLPPVEGSVFLPGAPRSVLWPTGARSVVVVYSHGLSEVPAAVKAVVLSVASRVLDSPSSVKQESIGAYSVTYTNGAPTLLDSEIGSLSRYRLN